MDFEWSHCRVTACPRRPGRHSELPAVTRSPPASETGYAPRSVYKQQISTLLEPQNMNASSVTSLPQRGNAPSAGPGAASLNLASSIPLPLLPLKGALFCLLVTFIIFYVRSPWKRLPPRARQLPIIGGFLGITDKKGLSSRECKGRFGDYRALICRMLSR